MAAKKRGLGERGLGALLAGSKVNLDQELKDHERPSSIGNYPLHELPLFQALEEGGGGHGSACLPAFEDCPDVGIAEAVNVVLV